MIKITAIEKKKRLYKVEFDNYNTIYVTEDTIVKYLMSKGSEFSQEELQEIEVFSNFSRGKNLAIYYISFKMRTKVEVIKYLQEHEIENKQIASIINSLEENKYIDDANYTENFINSKIRAKSSGPYLIKQKLKNKGVDNSLINEKLTDLYTEEEQIDIAYGLAEKLVMQKSSKLPLNSLKNKVIQNLTNKGFSYSIAKIALDALELEADNEIEEDLLNTDLAKALRRYSRKYEGYELKQRLFQAMARKGYDFDLINRKLNKLDF
jgi:Uncharacterized protein conserved in bacteria